MIHMVHDAEQFLILCTCYYETHEQKLSLRNYILSREDYTSTILRSLRDRQPLSRNQSLALVRLSRWKPSTDVFVTLGRESEDCPNLRQQVSEIDLRYHGEAVHRSAAQNGSWLNPR